MGHRAIVAYERADGLFNVHYSHWGAANLRLADDITDVTPFGGDKNEPDFLPAFQSMIEDATDDVEIGGYLAEANDTTAVESDPRAVGVPIERVVDEFVDYVMHEAVYVVTGFDRPDAEIGVRAYRTFSIPYLNESKGREETSPGLLVEPPRHDGEYGDVDSGWYYGVRHTLDPFVGDDGAIDAETAREVAVQMADGDTVDFGDFLPELQARAGESGATTLLTPDAAGEVLIHMMLSRHDGISKQVLSHSSLLKPRHYTAHPCAFCKPTGKTRKLGEMYPTAIAPLDPWEVAEEYDVPSTVNDTGLPTT